MIKLELSEAEETLEKTSEELKILLLPKDPNDDKNVIMEIRGGAGGDEANLFAYELYKLYIKYDDLPFTSYHFIQDIMAAIAVCEYKELNKYDVISSLKNYKPLARRFIKLRENPVIIDDFAHNPSKIGSSLAALKEYSGRLIVMYQSHSAFSAQNTHIYNIYSQKQGSYRYIYKDDQEALRRYKPGK